MELRNLVFDIIKDKGHIDIASFMQLALTDRPNSYYRAVNPFSTNSDFITAPEISQMFGEMIGIWIFNQISISGAKKFNIIEFGAGSGALLRDALKLLKLTPFADNFNVYIYDKNEELIKSQKQTLSGFKNIYWLDNLGDIPKEKSIFILNEFLDALPVRQFVKEKNTWKEVVIRSNFEGDMLIFEKMDVLPHLNEYLLATHKNANDGAFIEECEHAKDFIKIISNHAMEYDSSALIIDYGYDVSPEMRKSTEYGQTLQGIKGHKFTPILEEIGKSDLTAHVDFHYIRELAQINGAVASKTIRQGDFLKLLGIEIRLKELVKKNPDLKNILQNQYHRLVDYKQMGKLFKVMCISGKNTRNFLFTEAI